MNINVSQPTVLTPSEMFNTVRIAFRFTYREAAEVLHIGPSAILELESPGRVGDIVATPDLDRLQMLHVLATQWLQSEQIKGRWLHEPLSDGICVFDLLVADIIDEAALWSAHRQLLAARPRLMAAERTRATQAIQALKPAFERLAQNEALRRANAP